MSTRGCSSTAAVGVAAGLGGADPRHAARAAARRGGDRADRPARRLSARPARRGSRSAARSPARRRSRCCATAPPLLERDLEECDALIAISAPGEHARRRRTSRRSAAARTRERTRAAPRPADGDDRAVGDLRVPGRRRRPRKPACRSRSSRSSSTAPCLLDWDAEAAKMRRIAEVFDEAEEVRIVAERHRPDALAGRTPRCDRRRPHQHAGRRGLLLAGRGLGRRRDDVLRSFRPSTAAHEVEGVRLRLRARAGSSRRARRAARSFSSRRSTPTTGARAARRARHRLQSRHPAVHEEHRLRREDRRHRSTSRSATPTRSPAARTSEPSTGTSSRTCAPAAGSTPTASSCRRRRVAAVDRGTRRRPRRRGGRCRARARGSRVSVRPSLSACSQREHERRHRLTRARRRPPPRRAPSGSAARRRRGSRRAGAPSRMPPPSSAQCACRDPRRLRRQTRLAPRPAARRRAA